MEKPESDIFEEAKRIVDTASENDVTLKLLGGLATRAHCEILDFCERDYSDIDVVGLSREKSKIINLFSNLGYTPDTRFNALHGHKRLKFEENIYNRHVDVFLDHFDMEHDWDLSQRLGVEKYTLPLSDLLLMKLQILKINEKDIRDVVTMIKDSKIGKQDAPHTINIDYLAERCSENWGLYESVIENLEEILKSIGLYAFTENEKEMIEERVKDLKKRILNHPKTLRWRIRSKLGKHVKWFEDVEEE